MASKDEYYKKIIASLQSDISLNRSEISELKSMIARLQEEIDAFKASPNSPQKPSVPQQFRIDMEALRSEVKRVCDQAILANYERLPTMFADKREFDNFRKSAETKFLSADTLVAYKKSQETRLKSIDEKLSQRFSLLTINCHDKNGSSESKSYFNIDIINRAIKNGNLQWLKPIIIFLSICLLALYLINSITT